MKYDYPAEHFVTLFDSKFLPMGMALHASLMTNGRPFHLWIVCMDGTIETQLTSLGLPHTTPIPLASLETPELLAVKPGRSRGEYCWTLTPFTFQAVFDRDDSIQRVTYLDSDIFFFSDPQLLLQELDESGKHVLITEHAYAPEYEFYRDLSGRFCVQFMTFRRTESAEKVMRWWQERCLEWCYDRHEEGKFGDQKYLDDWPERFGDEVHILRQTDKTLAPWNAEFFEKSSGGILDPVFYHFQAFRIIALNEARLYGGYIIGPDGMRLYGAYLNEIRSSLTIMKQLGIRIPVIREKLTLKEKFWKWRDKEPHYVKLRQ